jgi:TRAP-type mannitol/chloroaromatic compound transport system substrate-binding protein
MRLKLVWSGMLMAAVLFVLAACGSDPTATSVPPKATTAPQATTAAKAPVVSTKVPPTKAPPVEAKEIKLIGAWPTGITITDWQEAAMIDGINKVSGGSLAVKRVAGPAEVHQAEQMEAVRKGIYHMMFTASAYFRELTQLPNVEAWVGGAPVALRESCGLEDIFRELYDKEVGVHYLGPSTFNSSAHIYLSELANEDRSVVDLTGLKLRGHALYKGGTEALGGSIVNMPSSEVYTGVQRGVIEGSVAGGDYMYPRDVKWHEIMNYVYNINLDKEAGHVYVNKSTWLGMNKQQQEAMYNGMVSVFEELEPELAVRKAEALATLVENGVEAITPPDAEVARVQGLWLEKNVPSVLTGNPDGPRVLDALKCIWKEVGLVVNL